MLLQILKGHHVIEFLALKTELFYGADTFILQSYMNQQQAYIVFKSHFKWNNAWTLQNEKLQVRKPDIERLVCHCDTD